MGLGLHYDLADRTLIVANNPFVVISAFRLPAQRAEFIEGSL